jgi:HK97 family phage prohead protease
MSDVVTLRAPEVRTSTVSLKLVDMEADGRTISGRAVPYNTFASIGWFAEQHAPKSFAKSIREAARKLPLLLWHNNASFPVGVSEEWDDNDNGLDCTWRMDSSEEAERAADLADKGMLTGLSIGFAPIRSEWEYVPDEDWDPNRGVDGMDKVTRLESRLLEVSLTPTPAFAGAKVSQVRSREQRREMPNHELVFPKREAWAQWLAANRRNAS